MRLNFLRKKKCANTRKQQQQQTEEEAKTSKRSSSRIISGRSNITSSETRGIYNNNNNNSSSSNMNSNNNTTMVTTFPQFSNIYDEGVKRLIISFIAEAPYERLNQKSSARSRLSGGAGTTTLSRYAPFSRHNHYDDDDDDDDDGNPAAAASASSSLSASLTSTLPYVNKEFYKYSNLNEYWERALLRQLQVSTNDNDDFHLWIEGLHRLLPNNYSFASSMSSAQGAPTAAAGGGASSSSAASAAYHMIEKQHRNMIHAIRYPQQHQQSNSNEDPNSDNSGSRQSRACCTCKDIYASIIKYHIQFVGPIFVM